MNSLLSNVGPLFRNQTFEQRTTSAMSLALYRPQICADQGKNRTRRWPVSWRRMTHLHLNSTRAQVVGRNHTPTRDKNRKSGWKMYMYDCQRRPTNPQIVRPKPKKLSIANPLSLMHSSALSQKSAMTLATASLGDRHHYRGAAYRAISRCQDQEYLQ